MDMVIVEVTLFAGADAVDVLDRIAHTDGVCTVTRIDS